jgi:DNA-binding transcriptional regulator YiaG
MDALPFCHLTIKAHHTPYPIKFISMQRSPREIHTIGDHIRKARVERRQFQRDLAQRFHVTVDTVRNWEQNRIPPHKRSIPAIVAWLGYDPRK